MVLEYAHVSKMDLNPGIGIVWRLLIVLFVTAVLVLIGVLLGNPLALVFKSSELAGLTGSALLELLTSVDGEASRC